MKPAATADAQPPSAEQVAAGRACRAREGLHDCESAAKGIHDELRAAQDELDRIDRLDVVTAAQNDAEANLKRRVRRLTGEYELAEAAAKAAEVALEAADREVHVAKLRDLDAEAHRRDRALVEEMITTASRWSEERDAIAAVLAEANSLAGALEPNRGVHTPSARGTMLGLEPIGPILVSAASVVERVAASKIQAKATEAMARVAANPPEPYRPPFDAQGVFDGEGPTRTLDWEG